jgi:tetratricopeptide (TPR) repeat protein
MRVRRRWVPLIGAAIAGAGWLAIPSARQARSAAAPAQTAPGSVDMDSTITEDERRARDIAFYETRVAQDSQSALDRTLLATLYVQRARATGDVSDYARAESLARRSLSLRTARNGQTFALLASTLMARHAFRDALDVARAADSLWPGTAAHLALRGEIELELGDYAAADSHFSAIRFDGEQFAVAARLARWRELTGRVDAARRLLTTAAAKVDRRDDLPAEQAAWFHFRLGELELRAGRLDAADSALLRGLAIHQDDYRILGALARLASARGEWQRSIDYGDRAIAIQLDPATLGTISDAYAAIGDTARANEYAHAMTVNALRQPGPIHRAWGLFVLDHGSTRDAKRVLAKAREEQRERHDVYGDDLVAWSLYRLGRFSDARAASTRALRLGTEDAQLEYHAGMIARASGDSAAAIRHLDRAMRSSSR